MTTNSNGRQKKNKEKNNVRIWPGTRKSQKISKLKKSASLFFFLSAPWLWRVCRVS
jgi:hypothetical protein